jgi:hypothetical protein
MLIKKSQERWSGADQMYRSHRSNLTKGRCAREALSNCADVSSTANSSDQIAVNIFSGFAMDFVATQPAFHQSEMAAAHAPAFYLHSGYGRLEMRNAGGGYAAVQIINPFKRRT